MLPEAITQYLSDLCREFSIPVGEDPSTVPLEKLVAGLGLAHPPTLPLLRMSPSGFFLRPEAGLS